MRTIDVRSDTITKPTLEMREAMKNAVVGDNVYNQDPTVIMLEEKLSKLFNKEAALFFPSGTMSNLTALLTWCNIRGSEIIVGDKSHIFLYEQSGASQFGGISYRTIKNNDDGTMDINDIKNSIRDCDIHEPVTKLICIENTHNACGGKILPLEYISNLKKIADQYKIPIHMDGARIWNALTETNIQPDIAVKDIDSLSVCLSKGLGAPVGSLLLGTKEFINNARRIRKALGGGMRQSGVLAAAGLIAIDDFMNDILSFDHIRTKKLVNNLKNLKNIHIHENIQTNIVFMDINESAYYVYDNLIKNNIIVSFWSTNLLRIVIHRDINDEDIDYIISKFIEIDDNLSSMNK
jgi:threonine aldolase